MKKLYFHVFSCEARVAPAHRQYQPGSRMLLLLWIREADEELAHGKAMAIAAEQLYVDVRVREVKHVDASENQFQGNLAAAFQQMLEVGWSVMAYPEPTASRH
jgi:hypothetical protein